MNQIEKYFTAEQNESILFVLVGLVALSFAAYFLVEVKQPFYNGMAYPFIAIALIQLTVGSSVYFRSPKDIIRVNNLLQNDPQKIQIEEIPRMNIVMKNFVLYRWIEIALIIVGIIVYVAFPNNAFWKGIGIGLTIQASFMLLLDFFAENRGKLYIKFLNNLN